MHVSFPLFSTRILVRVAPIRGGFGGNGAYDGTGGPEKSTIRLTGLLALNLTNTYKGKSLTHTVSQ